MSPTEINKLEEEFVSYQLLQQNEIPESVWTKAKVDESGEESYYRMDLIWEHLSSVKSADGIFSFSRITKVGFTIAPQQCSRGEGF